MRYRDLLVTTVSISSVLATNAVASDIDESKYIKLASVTPISESVGGVLIGATYDNSDNEIVDECISKGYALGVNCAPVTDKTLCVTERCKSSPSVGYDYIKCACYCNGENTCAEMGYPDESCTGGYILDEVCPLIGTMMKCMDNPCTEFDSTSCSAGYYEVDNCLSGTTTKYKCEPNPCSGYVTSCASGYVLDGSDTCLSGSITKYQCKADPCSGYDQTSACSPIAGYVQTTCLSGTTTKYKCLPKTCPVEYNQTSACSPVAGYTQTTCLEGAVTKYKCVANICPVEYNQTTPCSPASGYTETTCLSGATTKYRCLANACTGYYTSCNTGYYLDTSQSCQAGSITKYKCLANPCTGYTYTSCPAGWNPDGSCQSGPITKYKCVCHSDCHSCTDDLSSMSNVSIVTTDYGLRSAVAKANETVVIMSPSLTSYSGINLASGVKLVGPDYFSSYPKCTEKPTPSYTIMDNTNDAITMTSGGEINNLNISYISTKAQGSVVKGYGKLKDVTIDGPSETYVVRVPSGTMALEGDVIISSKDGTDPYTNDANIKIDDYAKVIVSGNTTIKGEASIGVVMGNDTDLTIASSGILTSEGDFSNAISNQVGSKFIVDGKLLMTGTASSAVGYIQFGGSENRKQAIVEFNSSGSTIKASYTGINCNNCNIKVNGDLTINMVNNISGSSSQKAIDLQTTYSGDYINAVFNSDITVNGLNSNSEDLLIYADDDTVVNGTITSTSNMGKIMVRGSSSLRLGASSHIKAGSLEAYVSTGKIITTNGAKLEFGGICKKATSNYTINGQPYITNANLLPITPFATSCSGDTPPPPPSDCFTTCKSMYLIGSEGFDCCTGALGGSICNGYLTCALE